MAAAIRISRHQCRGESARFRRRRTARSAPNRSVPVPLTHLRVVNGCVYAGTFLMVVPGRVAPSASGEMAHHAHAVSRDALDTEPGELVGADYVVHRPGDDSPNDRA